MRMQRTFPPFLALVLLGGLASLEERVCVQWSFSLHPHAVPMVGLLHGMVVHLPSLWAASVHSQRMVEMLEAIVYSHLLVLVILYVVQWQAPWVSSSCLWTLAVYGQLQAAWFVCRAARVPRCTLSPALLRLSMVASATLSAYALLLGACFASPQGDTMFKEHLFALLGAYVGSLPLGFLP